MSYEWAEIRQQYPDAFILLSDVVEERISATRSKIIECTILKVSRDAKEIRVAYQDCQRHGQQVIYTLPTTPEEFIVEDVAFRRATMF